MPGIISPASPLYRGVRQRFSDSVTIRNILLTECDYITTLYSCEAFLILRNSKSYDFPPECMDPLEKRKQKGILHTKLYSFVREWREKLETHVSHKTCFEDLLRNNFTDMLDFYQDTLNHFSSKVSQLLEDKPKLLSRFDRLKSATECRIAQLKITFHAGEDSDEEDSDDEDTDDEDDEAENCNQDTPKEGQLAQKFIAKFVNHLPSQQLIDIALNGIEICQIDSQVP